MGRFLIAGAHVLAPGQGPVRIPPALNIATRRPATSIPRNRRVLRGVDARCLRRFGGIVMMESIGKAVVRLGGDTERSLRAAVHNARWYQGKSSPIAEVGFNHGTVPVPGGKYMVALADVRSEGTAAADKAYAMVLPWAPAGEMSDRGIAPDATAALTQIIAGNQTIEGSGAKLIGQGTDGLAQAMRGRGTIEVKPFAETSSNTNSMVTMPNGERYVLQLIRAHGVADESVGGITSKAADMMEFHARKGYHGSLELGGKLQHVDSSGVHRTVGILSKFIPNEGDGFAYNVGMLKKLAASDGPRATDELIAKGRDEARRQGEALGSFHAVNTSGGPGSRYQALEPTAAQVAAATAHDATSAEQLIRSLPKDWQPAVGGADFPAKLRAAVADASASRTTGPTQKWLQTHGDFHGGQLMRQKDGTYRVVDVDGEPGVPLAKRLAPAHGLTDAVRQSSSYEYAVEQAIADLTKQGNAPTAEAVSAMRRSAAQSRKTFEDTYFEQTKGTGIMPETRAEFDALLKQYKLSNGVYELLYELNNRATDVLYHAPAARLKGLLQATGHAAG